MSLENHGKQSAYRIFGKFFIFGTQNNLGLCNIGLLEIKPCGLGSRIPDMEAEWRLKVITDLISW